MSAATSSSTLRALYVLPPQKGGPASHAEPAGGHRLFPSLAKGAALLAVLGFVAFGSGCGGANAPRPSPERSTGTAGMGGSSSGGAAGGRDPSGGTGGTSSVGMLGPGMGSAGAAGAADAATTDAAEGDGPGEDAGDADPGSESDAADAEPTSPPDTGPPPPSCGDGKLDPGEKCDQGDRNDKDAYGMGKCTDTCSDAPACGDQRIDTAHGEKCDRGSQNAANAYGPEACNDKCQPAPFCGDNTRQPGREECDEGARNTDNPPRYDQRACTKACKVVHPRCGDSTTQAPNEECDDGNRNVGGSYGTRGQCTRACKRVDFCGDAKVTMPQEQCEPPNTAATPGKAGCDARCRNTAPLAQCGNRMVEMGEECDEGPANRDTGTCTSKCKRAKCGDGIKQDSEKCDKGSANSSNAYGPDRCTDKCEIAPFCGDGTTQRPRGEECDNGPDNGKPGNDCLATCKTAPVTPKTFEVVRVEGQNPGRACDAACLETVRQENFGEVAVACKGGFPDIPTYRFGDPTGLFFAPLGGTPRGSVTLTLDAPGVEARCIGNDGGEAPVTPGGALPEACVSTTGSIRINLRHAEAMGCRILKHAHLTATVP